MVFKDVFKELQADKGIGKNFKQASGALFSDVRHYISTGAPNINYIIGQPGVPTGKVSTIIGPEGSGKSLLLYGMLKQVQDAGGLAMLIDSEGRFTRDRVKSMGVNVDDLLVVEGLSLEDSFAAIEKTILTAKKHFPDLPILIGYDSIAGSPTEKRLEAEVGAKSVASAALFISQELPRLKQKLQEHDVALVLVNQLRSRLNTTDPRGAMFAERDKVMGKEHTMIAENSILYESALILRTRFLAPVLNTNSDREHPIGIRVRVTNAKCGISPNEGYRAEIDILKDGIDIETATFELCIEAGYIVSAGGRYRKAYEGDSGKTFFRKDFADVLANDLVLQKLVADAPNNWELGNE